MASFEPPTHNQIFCLKRLSSMDGSFSLEEKDLEKLSKDKASRLIGSMLKNGRKGNGSEKMGKGDVAGFSEETNEGVLLKEKPLFSTNYRGENGAWQVARMTAAEEERLRSLHNEHCKQIMKECFEQYPNKPEAAIALFDKRADQFFTWTQKFLDEKVRLSRNGNGGGKNEQ